MVDTHPPGRLADRPTPVPEARKLSKATLPLLCLIPFMLALDLTAMNNAVPTIQRDLHFGDADMAWVIDAYLVTYGGFLLFGGRLSDVIGRRRILMSGIVVFTVASLAGGFVTGAAAFVAARLGQGLGAAVMLPAGLSLVATLFTDPATRVKGMAAFSAMGAVGAVLGQVIGGLLIEYASWHWLMWMNVPVGVLMLVSAPIVLPAVPGTARRLNVGSALIGTTGVSAVVFGVIKAGSLGWSNPTTVAALCVGGALVVGLVVIEARSSDAILPIHLLRNRIRAGAFITGALLCAIVCSFTFAGTNWAQRIHGNSPLQTGSEFVPMAIATIVGAAVAKAAFIRIGARPVLCVGGASWIAACALFTQVEPDTRYAPLVLIAYILGGLAQGSVLVAVNLLIVATVAPEEAGTATGVGATAQQVGGAIGLAVLASTMARGGIHSGADAPHALMHGIHVGLTIMAGLGVLMVAIAFATAPARARING
ncbi:MFS transporter [Nocardia tengchongensis]|uniref:MFS transporter n=1 Tax=Nocardia tengchongensis TaxID=2055889 RepID=UPI0036BC33D2